MAMNARRSIVVGVFNSREPAEQAVDALQRAGFRQDQIGFAMRGGTAAPSGAVDTVEGSNAGAGAATGAILGGLLGAAAALLIPGIGPVLAVGTLGGSVLTGMVAGGALGALAGALVGMGVPEDEARFYQGEFESGRAVVTVKAEARAPEAEEILRSFGAYDVNSRQPIDSAKGGTHEHLHAHAGGTEMHSHPHSHPAGQHEQHDHDHAGARMESAPKQAASMPAAGARMEENADTVKLREEQLRVSKERVQTGEVEIGKRVVSEQKTMEVPVTREEVVIERRPVNRPSDTPITNDSRTIEVPVTAERVHVEKETFVREEVGVQKRVEQDTVAVNETVRREEAVINRTGSTATADWATSMPTFRQHWQTNYGQQGRWEDYEPMYRYGYDQHASGKYQGRSWAQVEPELRKDWSSKYPNQAWDRASNPIKHAWDHLTATPHTHTR
jgi:uncharacterized protein (TIGR02271 family)